MPICKITNQEFELQPKEIEFYEKMGLPIPDICFEERLRRRLASYNRRHLYKRKCDATGQDIISWISPDKPYKIYNKDYRWSDQWDALEYGRDYDFSKTFNQQFHELMLDVPMLALAQYAEIENSDYTNDLLRAKNCYLIFDGEEGTHSMFGETFAQVHHTLDFFCVTSSEYCYEIMHCNECYNLRWSEFCNNCSNSYFLRDCKSCKNCFGCTNLSQKEYYIYNKPHTKEEYEKFISEIDFRDHDTVEKLKQKFYDFEKQQPYKNLRGTKNENVRGDNMSQSKDCYYCFDGANLRDCLYCTDCLIGARDCLDVHVWGREMDLCYNCVTIGEQVTNIVCSSLIAFGASNVYYSHSCSRGAHDLFGCISLQKKQYCILNKQYTKEEYEDLMPRIVEHMKSTGEWGTYFDPQTFYFGYNESLAWDYYPLEKEEALRLGYKWSEYETKVEAKKSFEANKLPSNSEKIPEEVLDWAIICEKSKKPFRLTKKEYNYYKEHKIPIPRLHPNQRHYDRIARKNPFT